MGAKPMPAGFVVVMTVTMVFIEVAWSALGLSTQRQMLNGILDKSFAMWALWLLWRLCSRWS